jgi:hypothetical protein
MKPISRTFLLSLTFLFLFSASVYGDDFLDAGDAYNRKDYKSASEETTEDPLDTINRYLYPPVEDPPVITVEEGPPLLEGDLKLAIDAFAKEDYKIAYEKSVPLVAQGNPIAQFILAEMYSSGKGVLQDYKEAAKLLRLAAEQGHIAAQHDLAVLYIKGQGVEQNYTKAFKWFLLGANRGEADSQRSLGRMFREGLGVTQDYIQAHMWFNIAGANNGQDAISKHHSKTARELRNNIANKMTSDQISKAQKLAKEWLDKNK